MKTTRLFLYLILPASLFLFSCQKDFSGGSGVTPTPVNVLTDSIYLDKILYLETTAGVTDTGAITLYQYDASHRVTGLNYTQLVSPGNYASFYRTAYAYAGADTLPYKSTDFDDTSFSNDTTTTFFTFSGTKRVKDSIMIYSTINSGTIYHSISKSIINYQYSPGNIYGREASSMIYSTDPLDPVGIIYTQSDTASLDGSGNLVAYRTYDPSSGPGMNSYFTYDSKRNPFSLLTNYYALLIFPSNETFIDEMQAKNNRLHAHETNGTTVTFDEDLTGKYIYKANGLPLSTTDDDGSGTVYKTIFVYKAF